MSILRFNLEYFVTANISIRITRRIVHIKIANTSIIAITIIAAEFRNTG